MTAPQALLHRNHPAPGYCWTVWKAVGLGTLYTGIAYAARDRILRFLRERRPTGLGAPLASLPRVQEKVGKIQSLLSINGRLTGSAAAQAGAGTPPSVSDAFLLKTVLTENAVLAVQAAVTLAGNHAHSRDHPMERHLRDVLCARVHVPNADAIHLAAGRDALAGGA